MDANRKILLVQKHNYPLSALKHAHVSKQMLLHGSSQYGCNKYKEVKMKKTMFILSYLSHFTDWNNQSAICVKKTTYNKEKIDRKKKNKKKNKV